MKIEQQEFNDIAIAGKAVSSGVMVTISAHNAIVLADRALRDGKTAMDGVHAVRDGVFVSVVAESDDVHYAERSSKPGIDERVRFLSRLIQSASAELARLDPDGLVSLRDDDRMTRIRRAV